MFHAIERILVLTRCSALELFHAHSTFFKCLYSSEFYCILFFLSLFSFHFVIFHTHTREGVWEWKKRITEEANRFMERILKNLAMIRNTSFNKFLGRITLFVCKTNRHEKDDIKFFHGFFMFGWWKRIFGKGMNSLCIRSLPYTYML